MPHVTKVTKQAEKRTYTKKSKPTLELETFTWKCTCGNKVKTQVRWYDAMCGKCKRGMTCNNTRGVVKELYVKV